ncbi:uncharacterized protein DFL_007516 [Arthrobotrys flagrans]|uniref:Uncharacterized protein n=1 Tax=Arthrobotrys flagrans TaxID=97331 RepID=A0A436ZWG8_ARTFL|nr:hypothetical protein DFL_007516 [Arthrobotrys flagrans]
MQQNTATTYFHHITTRTIFISTSAYPHKSENNSYLEEPPRVFRGFIEDLSLIAKHIYALPQGHQEESWQLEKTSGRSINSKANGTPTGLVNDSGPVAFLIPDYADPESLGWKLEKVNGEGERQHM